MFKKSQKWQEKQQKMMVFWNFWVKGPILAHQTAKFKLSGQFRFSRHHWGPWGYQCSGMKPESADSVTVLLYHSPRQIHLWFQQCSADSASALNEELFTQPLGQLGSHTLPKSWDSSPYARILSSTIYSFLAWLRTCTVCWNKDWSRHFIHTTQN